MNTYHVPIPHVDVGAGAIVQPLMEGFEENLKQDFEELMNEIPELKETPHRNLIVHGFATDAILEMIEKENVDLVILGTKGASGVLENFIGSVTGAIIKDCKCPVIAVPENGSLSNISKIVLATDYRPLEDENHLVEPLVKLANLYNADVDVFHVAQTEDKDIKARESAVLDHALEFTRHSFHISREQDVEKAILDYIKIENVDMIAVFPRHHSLVEKIFQTSISSKLAYHSKVPVLSLHE